MNATIADERFAILKMIESQQINAEQAADLLDALEPSPAIETTLPDATVEEEAWMLTALLQVTEAISSPPGAQDSVDDMLARIVRIVPLLAGVDRCSVYLWPGEGHAYVPSACYPLSDEGATPPASVDRLDQVRSSGQPVLLDSNGHAASALLPMASQGRCLGVMQVEYMRSSHAFSAKETAILSNVACQAAVGVEMMRLRLEAVERARLERELQLAHGVQTSLLPSAAPHIPGWEIASHWQAARSVGGDFYDFIPLGRGRLGLVIADVSGKGMSAALFMALARSIVRACAVRTSSTARVLQRANKLICADAHDGTFVTLFYGLIDAGSDTFVYSNAGHNPPILCRENEAAILEGRGPALGIVESASLPEYTVPLEVGDVVVLYTDGLTEAMNEGGEQFGRERLEQIVQANRHLSPQSMIDQVTDTLTAFVGLQPAHDDLTILVAKRV